MVRRILSAILTVSLCAGTLFAAPQIVFDTKAFQCGNVAEGKVDTLKAVFNIKNTGDKVLVLREVRPGCGCTVVKWDSTVQPGKSAKIEASVNIKGYHAGAITKYVTVTSNAGNDSVARLTIAANVQSAIDISPKYFTFKKTDPDKVNLIVLASAKKDLKVLRVGYEPNKMTLQGTTTQKEGEFKKLNQSLKFTWEKTDSIRADGYRIFKLNFFRPKFDISAYGQIVITTNHPDDTEVRVSANLNL